MLFMVWASDRYESIAIVTWSLEVAKTAETKDDKVNESRVENCSFGLAKVENFPLESHLTVA